MPLPARAPSPLLLAPLLCLAGLPAAPLPAQEGGQKKEEKKAIPTPPLAPGLLALSKEIDRLRRSAGYLVRLRVLEEGDPRRASVQGLHLGEGLVATAPVPDLEPGAAAKLWAGRETYRALSLGNFYGLASFFRFRDLAHHEPLPEPGFLPAEGGEVPGSLVLVLERNRARLALLDLWRSPTLSRTLGRPRRRPGRISLPWTLPEKDLEPGSAVLAMNGRLLGLLARPEYPSRRRSLRRGGGGKAGEKGKEERARSPGRRCLVLEGRFLLLQARKIREGLAKKKIQAPPPSLGVSLFPSRARGAGATAPQGFRVYGVSRGGPADRAGVRRGDRWIALNGKPLTDRNQIREALRAPGGGLEITFLRGEGEERKLRLVPD